MAIKKNDFIEIDFVGRIKSNNAVFDLTYEELAKKEKLYDPNMKYGPRIICVGNGDLIKALDENLIGKEIGKEYKIELKNPFGDKNNSLVKILPVSKFTKERINPFPGLQINADGMLATVKSVSGGRVVLDFNHPLAGKDIIYEVKINKIVEDNLKKLKAFVENLLGEAEDHFKVEGKDNDFIINIKHDIPKALKDKFKEKAKEVMPDIKVEFVIAKGSVKE